MLVRPHFQRLVERARMRPVVRAAFVYPADRDWLQLALSAAFAGFFEPVLVGPEARIRDTAEQAGLDISRLAVANTPDSTGEAAACAVELARAGAVAAFVRCSLANEDLLGRVAAADSGLRTDRRLSHAHFVDLPALPHGLLLADAVLNIAPTLGAKKDVVRNTIDLAHAIGVAEPRVAVLSAVGTPSPAFASSLDAQVLTAMATHGIFGGAVVDGPLTADVALSVDAARLHGVESEVAGRSDVLIAPAMESAALLLRMMTTIAGGFAAGIVLGARLPIVLPTRFESMETRIAACVLASLYANRENARVETDAAAAALARTEATRAGHAAAR
ncbi:MAG: bifunctional enoyl-CoA hydratase/phosphate acetyltransferase [Casimicrobiaceae bacterium]